MATDLNISQNETGNLELMAAARQAYSDAKFWLAAQFFTLVALPVIGSFLSLWNDDWKSTVALVVITCTLVDLVVVDHMRRAKLRLGASLQERFDCNVLGISWNPFFSGTSPVVEDITSSAKKYLRKRKLEAITNWYPDVSLLPIELGRIVCQRTNLWYDRELRMRVGSLSLCLSLIVSIAFVLYGVVFKMAMDDWILKVFLPIVPIITWGVREYARQREATQSLERNFNAAEALWQSILDKKVSRAKLNQASQDFQTAIYLHRRSAPPIFDWVYDLLRRRLEGQMQVNANQLIEDARKAKLLD